MIIIILNFKLYFWEFHTCMQRNMVTSTSYRHFLLQLLSYFPQHGPITTFSFLWPNKFSCCCLYVHGVWGHPLKPGNLPVATPQNRKSSSSVRAGTCRYVPCLFWECGWLAFVQGLRGELQRSCLSSWVPWPCRVESLRSQRSSHPPALTSEYEKKCALLGLSSPLDPPTFLQPLPPS